MPESLTPPSSDPVATLVFFLVVFLAVGAFFLFIHLFMGSFLRPYVPDAEKLTIYECGEPAVGSAWIQFDLRYYVVALLFVVFDVEVAFFFPWAMVFGKANQLANLPPEQKIEKKAVAEKGQSKKEKDDAKGPVEPKKAMSERERLTAQLLPSGVSRTVKTDYKLATYEVVTDKKTRQAHDVEHLVDIESAAARSWARLAFLDILIFFGVLLVGFAYVWRRGDIDWIRTVTHRGGEHPVNQLPQGPG